VGNGKLTIAHPYETFIPRHLTLNRIQILEAGLSHYAAITKLPRHHRDPFDRLIIAQSLIEKLPVVSIDDKFDLYSIERIW